MSVRKEISFEPESHERLAAHGWLRAEGEACRACALVMKVGTAFKLAGHGTHANRRI
jgi:hypothetical protein